MAKIEKEKKKTEKNVQQKDDGKNIVRTKAVGTRGRVFEGLVVRKFPKRITIEFERTLFIHKYERFIKKKTRIHARLPDEIANDINISDYVRVKECRPLSKIIHFIVIKKLRSRAEEAKQ